MLNCLYRAKTKASEEWIIGSLVQSVNAMGTCTTIIIPLANSMEVSETDHTISFRNWFEVCSDTVEMMTEVVKMGD